MIGLIEEFYLLPFDVLYVCMCGQYGWVSFQGLLLKKDDESRGYNNAKIMQSVQGIMHNGNK